MSLFIVKPLHSRLLVIITSCLLAALLTSPTAAQSPENLLQSSSFEEGLGPWWQSPGDINEGDCNLTVRQDSALAQEGDHFLSVTRSGNCLSLFQDAPQELTAGDIYRYAIWIRAASANHPRKGTLVVWQLGGQISHNMETKFYVTDQWQCVETRLEVTDSTAQYLRSEIYFDSPDNQSYYFDNARLQKGDSPLCPPAQADNLINPSFEQSSTDPAPWQFANACDHTIYRNPDQAQTGAHLLAMTPNQAGDCKQLYQQLFAYPQPNQIYRLAAWVKSEAASSGRLRLFALHNDNRQLHGDYVAPYEEAAQYFSTTTAWQCVETSLIVTNPSHTHLQAALSFDTFTEKTSLHVDHATFQVGGEPICPAIDYEIVSQYPPATNFTLKDVAYYEVKLRNTSSQTWYRQQANGCTLHLVTGEATYLNAGTTTEPFHVSPYYQSGYEGWLEDSFLGENGTRLVMVEEAVAPGEIGTFRFKVRVPGITSEILVEHWIPTLEGASCQTSSSLAGPSVAFGALIFGYQAEFYSQLPTGKITMAPGETREISVKFRNKNELRWPLENTRLGTVHPETNAEDYPSPFYHESWLNDHRPDILPAKTDDYSNEGYGLATFSFIIQAPAEVGDYKFRVRPIVEHVQWMGPQDMAVYWQITVSDSQQPVPVPEQHFGNKKTFGPANDHSQAVAAGDINGDGTIDLVVANWQEQNAIYFNDGQGNLGWPVLFGTPNGLSHDVALADMNNDGWLDIVVANRGRNRLHFNDGAGQIDRLGTEFGEPTADSYALAIGDLDQDGWLDIAVSNFETQNYLYHNSQSGQLATGKPFGAANSRSRAIALGDVDQDGRLDIVLGNYQFPNQLFRNQGQLEFTETDFDLSGHNATHLQLADIDGNGTLDIIIGNSDQRTALFINAGAADFFHDEANDLASEADALTAGDLNNDGMIDLVTGINGGQNECLLNNGYGQFPTVCQFGTRKDKTTGLTLADMNQDGFLDIVTVNETEPNAIYLNQGGGAFHANTRLYFGPETATDDIAVADFNQDGWLDFLNSHGHLFINSGQLAATSWLTPVTTLSAQGQLAIGDLNSDTQLDIVASNGIWLNDHGSFSARPFGSDQPATAIAIADIDGDVDLDIIAGYATTVLVYLNDGAGNYYVGAADCDTPPENLYCLTASHGAATLAIGDLDGDSSLDIVVGLQNDTNRIYLNRQAGDFEAIPFGNPADDTTTIALGDLDQNGTLDIVVGNYFGQQNYIYFNDGPGRFDQAPSQPIGSGVDWTTEIVLADMNNDGWLDVVMANDEWQPNIIYLNDHLGQFTAAYLIGASLKTKSLAVGDVNHDGTLDLIEGNADASDAIYLNQTRLPHRLANNNPRLVVNPPGNTGQANFFARNELLTTNVITIPYHLFDAEADPVSQLRAFYSINGGGQWFTATPTSDTVTTNLASSISGTHHLFGWDMATDGLFGTYDQVMVRLAAQTNRYETQWPDIPATTTPFRIRGTQVRVVEATKNPVANAFVYVLPAEQTTGANLLADGLGQPFLTNAQGYLAGNGEINLGDTLLALAPVTWTNSYVLYHTNGSPTETGLQAFTVTEPGVQEIVVSADQPLYLFDLELSLEWDAHNDPIYLQQLAARLQAASTHIYNFTNGQAALGHVVINQNGDNWAGSDVVVYASNRLRPWAVQGGIVYTDTVDPLQPEITYHTGFVAMAKEWNRYGDNQQSIDDWSLTLAHELSHYLFFQDDVYLGVRDGLLIAKDDCESIMGDMYNPDNRELIHDEAYWQQNCHDSLAGLTLQRPEWQTMKLWYQAMHSPTHRLPGPSRMPFPFTTIERYEPLTPTNPLEDTNFELTLSEATSISPLARGFLLKDMFSQVAGFDTVIDVGGGLPGINRLTAPGAAPGDRLCLFDTGSQHYGCKIIQPVDNGELPLTFDDRWTPQVVVRAITSRTFTIAVTNLPTGLNLQARLYPEYAAASQPINLTENELGYQETITLPDPTMRGHVHLWTTNDRLVVPTSVGDGFVVPTSVGDGSLKRPLRASASNDTQEIIISYLVGGNPGDWPAHRTGGPAHRTGGPAHRTGGPAHRTGGPAHRTGGPAHRTGGPAHRTGGPAYRNAQAPTAAGGSLIVYTENPVNFKAGDIFTIQPAPVMPPLPPGKVAPLPGYYLLLAPGRATFKASLSFEYLSVDTRNTNISEPQEEDLVIHFWDGETWRALETIIDTQYNLASAPSQGEGLYALLAGQTRPHISLITPTATTNEITTSLTISGQNLLPPLQLQLHSPATSYTLPVQKIYSNTVMVIISAGLVAAEYDLTVVNLLDEQTSEPVKFAIYEAHSACFYDFFDSGLHRWQGDDEWGIVNVGTAKGLTDSPGYPYQPAYGGTTVVRAITSTRFSLVDCPQPKLIFDHVHQLAGQDTARLDISTDDGRSWQTLASYSNDIGCGNNRQARTETDEWGDVRWQNELIDLSPYHQSTDTRLRLSLEVDQRCSEKGWLIDYLMITSLKNMTHRSQTIYLPLINK